MKLVAPNITFRFVYDPNYTQNSILVTIENVFTKAQLCGARWYIMCKF